MAPLLIRKKYEDDDTAVHIASLFETQYDIIGELVRAGAPVNSQNCFNETPLFVAVENENARNARKLVSLGARSDKIESRRGKTPIHVATINDDFTMLKLLTRRNSVDVNIMDQDGKTPLSYAIIRNSRPAVQHLLELGADTSLKDGKGLNALHMSVMFQNADITADVLTVANESLINERTVEGKSPLLIAVDRQSKNFDTNAFKMIDILLQSGADPHQKNNSGETAIELACNRGVDLETRLTAKPS